MPEEVKEEAQDEFGWEDLRNHDDGSRDMVAPAEAAPKDPEPTPVEEAEKPTETPAEPTPEPEVKADEPTGEAAKTPEETEETTPPDTVYTLPGGEKITHAELVADPDRLAKLVTHSNQLTLFQKLAEDRKAELSEAQAEKRKLLDQYTEWEMSQRMAAEQPGPVEPPQRPPSQVLAGVYAPHLDKLVTDGRLTADQRTEFGNVLSEYMFDQQNTQNLITEIVRAGVERMDTMENQLRGEVVPDVQRRQQQDAVYWDQVVQQGVAAKPGYESLAEPEEWNRLKLFISEKVNASPKDNEGNPTFDPQFDVDSMAQMFDAMTGSETRATLAKLLAAQEEIDKRTTTMVGGETAARAGGPPPKKPSALTPEQEAMDFHDPSMATG